MMALGVMLSCSTEQIGSDIVTADAKANVEKGRPRNHGKTQNAIYLKASPDKTNSARVSFNGRIMDTPVDYLGDISDVSSTVDWDNDGTDDVMTITQSCYMPKTFIHVLVNDQLVNDFTPYHASLVGFKDVNGDGFKDAIFRNGISEPYQDAAYPVWDAGQSYNVGDKAKVLLPDTWWLTTFVCMQANTGNEPSETSTFWRLEYSVGYNVAGDNALTLQEVIESLVITGADNNPSYIKWDLTAFGIHNFPFHVYLYDVSLADGKGIQQTTTYGEFGFSSLDRIIPGTTYVLDFSNLGPDCTKVQVYFIAP